MMKAAADGGGDYAAVPAAEAGPDGLTAAGWQHYAPPGPGGGEASSSGLQHPQPQHHQQHQQQHHHQQPPAHACSSAHARSPLALATAAAAQHHRRSRSMGTAMLAQGQAVWLQHQEAGTEALWGPPLASRQAVDGACSTATASGGASTSQPAPVPISQPAARGQAAFQQQLAQAQAQQQLLPQRPCRPRARHQRSASLGLPAAASAHGIGAWWTGPLPPGAPPGGAGAGGFLGAGGWGGALGSLVAESLGASTPSFCLDPAALARVASSRGPSRAPSSVGLGWLPTCLICLDSLTPDEFESGEAIRQACSCKGDVALRHRRCAVQWSLVKRSTVCDVCRAPIANLPELPPEALSDGGSGGPDGAGAVAAGAAGGDAWEPLALGEFPPGPGEYLSDAVRVMWMTLVGAVLFFDVPLRRAFAIGAVLGVTLTAAAHALAMAVRSAATVRAFAAALRERAWVHGQQRQLAAAAAGTLGWGVHALPAAGSAAATEELLPLRAAMAPGETAGGAGSVGTTAATGGAPSAALPASRPGHSRAPSAAVLLIPEEEDLA